MLPGPSEIHGCPGCGKTVLRETLASGNTFGARAWTDGKVQAPMLPDPQLLTRCPRCDRFFWFSRRTLCGHMPASEAEESGLQTAPQLSCADDYFAAIEAGLGKARSREKYLRISAWHAENDLFRKIGKPPKIGPEEARRRDANLRRLRCLLDRERANERLMLAEIARELGEFEEARALLKQPFPGEYREFQELIAKLVGRGDRRVRELRLSP